LDTHDETLESHASTLDTYDARLDTHDETLESHASTLDTYDARLDTHDETLESYGERITSAEGLLEELIATGRLPLATDADTEGMLNKIFGDNSNDSNS
jgi:ABC-type transporter Mla subunit MlaD